MSPRKPRIATTIKHRPGAGTPERQGEQNGADPKLSHPDYTAQSGLMQALYRGRVRSYESDKRRLPKGLGPIEYQEAVKALAARWRI